MEQQIIDCKVVMLPTKWNQNLQLFKNKFNGRLIDGPLGSIHDRKWESQHLYFTSDEKPAEGGYYIHSTHGSTWVLQATATDVQLWMNGHEFGIKVVASTDPSLGLPAIPQDWIRDTYVLSDDIVTNVRLKHGTEGYPSVNFSNEVIIMASLQQLEQPDCDIQAIMEAANKGGWAGEFEHFEAGYKANPNKWSDEEVLDIMSKIGAEVHENGYGEKSFKHFAKAWLEQHKVKLGK